MNAPPDDRRSDVTAVEVAKLEGRMDQGFTSVNGRLDTMIAEMRAEREARRVEAGELRKDVDDHEGRLRVYGKDIADLKARPAITWKALWAAVVSGVTVAGVIVGIVMSLLRAVKG